MEQDREVRGDPQRLSQAVSNLIDNSINALQDQPEPHIEVSVAHTSGGWSLVVEDNGPGIPDDDLAHVFRRFYRVDEHRNRDQGGVGLGLSLVRAIAEAHGGEAVIERRLEQRGTRATLRFPLADD